MLAGRVLLAIVKAAFVDGAAVLALGVTTAIAASSIVFQLALNRGVERQIQTYVSQWDLDSLVVVGTSPTGDPREGRWTEAEIDRLRASLTGRANLAVYKFVKVPVATATESYSELKVMAADATMLEIKKKHLTAGFAYDDTLGDNQRYCIIGAAVNDTLCADHDCVGDEIRLGAIPFKVRGVFSPSALNGALTDEDREIWIPISVAKRTFFVGNDTYRSILVKSITPTTIHLLASELSGVLRKMHDIKAEGKDDFQFTFPDEIEVFYRSANATVRRTTTIVAVTALLLGGLTAAGTAIMWVGRRQQEIALKLAIGATRRRVNLELIGGTIVLSGIGAVLGAVIGIGLVSRSGLFLEGVPLELDGRSIGISVLAVVLMVIILSGTIIVYRTGRVVPASTLHR